MTRIMIPNSRVVNMDSSSESTEHSSMSSSEQDVAVLAYHLWQARGCPEGSPEVDWYMAKEQLEESISSSTLSMAAKA